MYKEAGKLFFSPTDLTTFVKSPFASWMQRLEVESPLSAPEKDPESEMTKSLSQKGYEHEQNLLDDLINQGLHVEEITDELISEEEHVPFNLKHQATVDAIDREVDVVFQAALQSGQFRGFADFLIKKSTSSGQSYYEVWDTKLSSTIKPAHIIQLCCYTDILITANAFKPDSFVVVLGSGEQERLYVDDYFHYYLALKDRFLRFHDEFDENNMPDPANSKMFGRWESFATEQLKARDHVSLIANITRTQVKKLCAAGVESREKLLSAHHSEINGIQVDIFEKLKKQASLQLKTNGRIPPQFEIKHSEQQTHIGLSLLPPHSAMDIFFDIEGYPLTKGGLEYLWGSTYYDESGNRTFGDFWAHNADQEKAAFEAFIQWVYKRWIADPAMHIYHYANYEIAACRKLMGRYGVCEYELDQLLRNDVFVDLYKIVIHGLVVGEPRYSIKNIEHLYRGQRDTEVESGGDSVVVYEKWQTLHRAGLENDDWQESEILRDIRDYNIDDCNSTEELTIWLRKQQAEHNIPYMGTTETVEPDISEEVTARSTLRDELLDKVHLQPEPQKSVTENLAWSLEFHRREIKPLYWRLFDRLGMEHNELLDDMDCLAMCHRTDREPFKPTARSRNMAYEYQMSVDQEFKPPRLASLYLLEPEQRKVNLIKDQSDFDSGLIVIQASHDPATLITLIPDEYISPGQIPQAIDDVVNDYNTLSDSEFDSKHSAIADYLFRRKPNIKGCRGNIVHSEIPDEKLKETITAINNLNKSYLIIQGPPGSGKTYTGKHVIANLLSQGKSVGISSNSHKAINHLLCGVATYCKEQQIAAATYATKNTGEELQEAGVEILTSRELADKAGPGVVIGTTAWGFCRSDLINTFDYLFIDEAGQVPMARLVGMSRATDNLILMGDQMQLSQPSQGTHPAESGLSILDYALGDTAIVASDMGIFLGTSFRMHSKINDFISPAFYQGKLLTDPQNDAQELLQGNIQCNPPLKSAGIQFISVEHSDNQQASDEEAQKILELSKALMGCQYRDKNRDLRPVTLRDMLFLSPYNHQVNRLQTLLGADAKVGTVDKFQGQEAPIVFYSLCSSEPSESPRGLEFLYDRNRTNVAISRGQCLVFIIGSPALACPDTSTIEQMKLANNMSRLLSN